MNYKELNQNQRTRMNDLCRKTDVSFEWEDQGFLEILAGKLPPIRHLGEEEQIRELLWKLEAFYKTYDAFETDPISFLCELDMRIKEIRKIKPYWYGLNFGKVEECIRQHRICLISGEGGIGKSYFVKCLEEKLEEQQIPHLCLYGKFIKDISNIDFEEIANAEKFVLIVDAINEMLREGQLSLLEHLRTLKQNRNCRIVLTYRTHKVEEDILSQYNDIAEAHFQFPGVSFESALSCLVQKAVPDVYLYEDILYSHNPLLLNMLQNCLDHLDKTPRALNNLTSITYVLEQYIKNSLSKDIWLKTKEISKWMYQHNKKSIAYDEICQIVKQDPGKYVDEMLQMNFLVMYGDNSEYVFGLEMLSDFLLARNLMSEISGKDIKVHASIIKKKTDELYGLEEAIILLLFDRFQNDYAYIKVLLLESGLFDYFRKDTLRKISFKEEDIPVYQQHFKVKTVDGLFETFAGYVSKPYNCTHYLNEILFNKEYQMKYLSSIMDGRRYLSPLKNRLKNILYANNAVPLTPVRKKEAFWFALWCCAAPNSDVRHLAIKLLFEIVDNSLEYRVLAISLFPSIHDCYIQEAIILALSKCIDSDAGEIRSFFEGLAKDISFILGRSLKRIAAYLGTPYGYIEWTKVNLRDDTYDMSAELESLISHADLIDSSFLPFRYWGRDHIDMYEKFLGAEKNEICQWNTDIRVRFACVKEGTYCCGSMRFDERIAEMDQKNYKDLEIGPIALFNSYAKTAQSVLDFYGLSEYRLPYGEEFSFSVHRKCLDVAKDMLLGSFMCNYYSSEFGTYNTKQNTLGYEVYDPLEYEEAFSVTAPLPSYRNASETLCDNVLLKLEIPENRDEIWVRDLELTRRNLQSLLTPVDFDNYKWILLAGRINISEEADHHTVWADKYDYWCCTSSYEEITGYDDDRYLTIELDAYRDNLLAYTSCLQKPWLCKDLPSLGISSVFQVTGVVLPPAQLIKDLELSLDSRNMTWVNAKGEIIIYCNNAQYSYYSSPIGNTVFIRKDIYDQYVANRKIKFFAFAERYHPNTGYADETSYHFEIEDGRITKEYRNYNAPGRPVVSSTQECLNCPYGFYEDPSVTQSRIEEALAQLELMYGNTENDSPEEFLS